MMPVFLGTPFEDTLNGTTDFDVIVGYGGDDQISDQGGAPDELYGGDGNDIYFIGANSTIVEYAEGGRDVIFTNRAAFTMPANIEEMTFTSGADVVGIGNSGNNVIRSGPGRDTLVGLEGNDVLNGDLSANGVTPNTLIGGPGDDSYLFVMRGDSIVELPGEGNDYVETFETIYFLAPNIERLFGRNPAPFTGIGNAEDNFIASAVGGGTLVGLGGNDQLLGASNIASTLIGGTGDDYYGVQLQGDSVIERADEGIDRVGSSAPLFVLPDNVENLLLFGGQNANGLIGIGNALDNTMEGDGGADTLVGLAGADRLIGRAGAANTLLGGIGDDVYVVAAAGDSVIEYAGEGLDRVQTALPFFVLPDHVEALEFTGLFFEPFLGLGNALDNIMVATSIIAELHGYGGNDRIFGSGQNLGTSHRLFGGTGDDVYVIGGIGDIIVERVGEGTDTIETSYGGSLTLPAFVENLTVTVGPYVPIMWATGNELNNVITGAGGDDRFWGLDGDDVLTGGAGDDQLTGGNGLDRLTGGAGADAFRYEIGNTGIDTITDFLPGTDRLVLPGAFLGSGNFSFVFAPGAAPTQALPTLLYDQNTGIFSYDADGTGSSAAIALFDIGSGLTLQLSDCSFY